MTSGYIAALFISIDRMPFLVPSLDSADPLFALLIAPGLYLHHDEVADTQVKISHRINCFILMNLGTNAIKLDIFDLRK